MSGQTWMPHAGHFIGGSRCRFMMCTHVNGVVVSTVGEYTPHGWRTHDLFEPLGCDRLYETMVFRAVPSSEPCCPFDAVVSAGALDFAGYNDPGAAFAGHMVMLDKWGSR